LARILIPVALWFWVDINEEIADRSPGALTLSYRLNTGNLHQLVEQMREHILAKV
jgi:hypothetical protein